MTRPVPKRHLVFIITEDWFFRSHFIDRAAAAVGNGYAVTVITRCRRDAHEIADRGMNFVNFEFSRRGINPILELGSVIRLGRILRRLRPDIVHNIALKPVVVGSLASRLANISTIVNAPVGMGYVFTSDETKAKLLRPIVRWLVKRVLKRPGSKVIIENPDDRNNLVTGGFASPTSITLIKGAGVDLGLFRPNPNNGLRTPVRVVMIARVLRDKGVAEYISAARILKLKGVDAEFMLAGGTDQGNPTSYRVSDLASLNFDNAVCWLDNHGDVAKLLRDSDIACLPSYREGLPKSLIEAAAVGLPIVTTNVTGCREVVQEGVNGLLVQPRNPVQLAEALQKLIENSDLRRQMGIESRLKAEREFANEIIIRQTLQLYDSI